MCIRDRDIIVGLMTDGRFSGGSVGLVIGHVGPEAAVGGPIGLIKDKDEIVVDLNKNTLTCTQLLDENILRERKNDWKKIVDDNNGLHPSVGIADTRLLNRMRSSAVSAIYGAGMHPDRKVWIPDPREIKKSDFIPKNIYKN